ncbi:MAG: urease accessory protein UreD [Steroidobacteraceae bacterium]
MRRGPESVLADLYQEGCLKARFPRTPPGAPVSVVLLNSAGGVVPGDRLDQVLTLEAGTEASVVSAGAERFYRGLRGDAPAQVRTTITLGAGATLEWLPQESILFDATALDRTLAIDMEEDARLLAVEALLFGRAAMGEALHRIQLVDRLRIRRAGRLVWQDAVRLSGDAAALMQHPATGGGAAAVAGIVFTAPEATARLEALRNAMAAAGYDAGVTCRDGVLFARLVARDGAVLRERIAAALAVLRTEPDLPRNWCC